MSRAGAGAGRGCRYRRIPPPTRSLTRAQGALATVAPSSARRSRRRGRGKAASRACVGRTARAGKAGKSVAFVTQYTVPALQKIEFMTKKRLEKYPLDDSQVLVFQERV